MSKNEANILYICFEYRVFNPFLPFQHYMIDKTKQEKLSEKFDKSDIYQFFFLKILKKFKKNAGKKRQVAHHLSLSIYLFEQ